MSTEPAGPTPVTVSVPRSVLVVGGGLAGFHTAAALRRRGFAGVVTVVGAETHAPYDRPPLSKEFLAGTMDVAGLALDDADAPLDVTWVRGTVADHLVLRSTTAGPQRGVRTADGRELLADAVVLATGADAIRLSPAGRLGPPVSGVHVLRTLEDAAALRADHPSGRDVVVVGTGFVGLEAASAAVSLGAASVTVISPEEEPLADRLGRVVGAAIRDLHERHGVRFLCGVTVTGLACDEQGTAVGVTVDGVRPHQQEALAAGYGGEPLVPADLVVVGIGARPATGWLSAQADELGLRMARGGELLCDVRGRTGLPGVWAVGDCSRWARPDQDGHSNAGHWQDALDQAGVVAADLTGQPAGPVPPSYFWSTQHGVRLQVAGHLAGGETAVVRAGAAGSDDLLVTYLRDGVETAILAIDRPRDVMRWRREHRLPLLTVAGSGRVAR